MAYLALVLQGGEHIRPSEQLQIGFWTVAPNLLEERLESNHEKRCLTTPRALAGSWRAPSWVAVLLARRARRTATAVAALSTWAAPDRLAVHTPAFASAAAACIAGIFMI